MNSYTDALFEFAERRQAYYLTGVTNDYVLHNHFFSNIYCEQDPQTALIRRAINDGRYPRGILPAFVRVMFDQSYTLNILIQNIEALNTFIDTGNYTDLLHVLRSNYCSAGGEYLLSVPKGYGELEGILLAIRNLRERSAWKETEQYIADGVYSYKTIAQWLSTFQYIAHFLAGETTYELTMMYPGKLNGTNEYIALGNSTLRGLARLQGEYRTVVSTENTVLRLSKINQEQAQPQLQTLLHQAWDRGYESADKKPWRLREVARAVGEFDRYERFRLGQRTQNYGQMDDRIFAPRRKKMLPT